MGGKDLNNHLVEKLDFIKMECYISLLMDIQVLALLG